MAARKLVDSQQVFDTVEQYKREGKRNAVSLAADTLGFDRSTVSTIYHKERRSRGLDVVAASTPADTASVKAAVAEVLREFGIAPAAKPALPEIKPVQQLNKRAYIITGWEIRVKPSEAFIDCLTQIARQLDAEMLLTPVWVSDVSFMPEVLRRNFHLAHSDLRLNRNLAFQYCPTHALIKYPLNGWRGGKPNETLIIPALGRQLITEPSDGDIPRQKITTGSVGRLDADIVNYQHVGEEDQRVFQQRWASVKNRKLGRQYHQALQFVKPSALIVEIINDDLFITRFVTMQEEGIVYDLGYKYTAGQSAPEPSRPLGLNVGDLHAIHVDPQTFKATLEMIQTLQPEQVVLHDVFDGASVNHHERGRDADLVRFPELEAEVAVTKQVLSEVCDVAEKVIYMASNHDDFILKGLLDDPGMWRINRNYQAALELQLFRLKHPDRHPIEKLLDLESFDNLYYVSDKEMYYVGKTHVSHGHIGINGARPNFTRAVETFGSYSQGHGHVPTVLHDGTQVGVTGDRKPGYVKGASGWLGANSVIQPDSSQQLLPIIHDIWQRG